MARQVPRCPAGIAPPGLPPLGAPAESLRTGHRLWARLRFLADGVRLRFLSVSVLVLQVVSSENP